MPLCMWIYRSGQPNPMAKLCGGRPGVALSVPAYRVEPDSYAFSIMQDRDPYGAPSPPFVLENISDSYSLKIVAAASDPSFEVEPDDAPPVASPIWIGGEVKGRFGWTDDVDVVCLKPSDGPQRARWVVVDAAERPRDRGAVLQVTPANGPRPGVGVRVHRMDLNHKATSDDLIAPWKSEPFDAAAGSPSNWPDHAFDARSMGRKRCPLDAAGQQRAVGDPCRSRTVALGSLPPPLVHRSVQRHCCARTTQRPITTPRSPSTSWWARPRVPLPWRARIPREAAARQSCRNGLGKSGIAACEAASSSSRRSTTRAM